MLGQPRGTRRITHVGRAAVRTPKQFRTAAARPGPVQLRLADGQEPAVRTVAAER